MIQKCDKYFFHIDFNILKIISKIMLIIDLIKFTIKTKLNRNDKKQKNPY